VQRATVKERQQQTALAERGIKPGPQPIEIDPDRITKWATVGWRWMDIAAELEIDDRTLRRRRAVNPALDRAYQKGLSKMRRSLRSKQFQLAMEGSITMLIWLGKNELGQSDRLDTRSLHLHANAGSDSEDSLSALSTEELRERLSTLREMEALEEGAIDIEGEDVTGGD